MGLTGNILDGDPFGGVGTAINLTTKMLGGIIKICQAGADRAEIARMKKECEAVSRNARAVLCTPNFHHSNFSTNGRLQLFAGEQQYLLPEKTYSDEQVIENASRSSMNMVVSGGSRLLRNEALSFVCKDACARRIPVILVHCGNHELIRKLRNIPSIASKLVIADKDGYTYNPFLGLRANEISEIVVEAIPDRYNTYRNAQNHFMAMLVTIIAELVLTQGKSLTIPVLAVSPIKDLPNVLDKKKNDGSIDHYQHAQLTADYMACQSEVHRLSGYLQELKRKSAPLYTKGARAVDMNRELAKNSIIALNVGDSLNDIYLGLITEHLRYLYTQNARAVVIVDGVNLSSQEKLVTLLAQHEECNFALSNDDIYTSLGADKKKFESAMGHVARAVFFKHSSLGTVKQLSEYLGTYEKIEYLQGFTQGTTGLIPTGQKSWTPHKTTEPRIRQEDLANMTDSQVCVYDSSTNQICFADMQIH